MFEWDEAKRHRNLTKHGVDFMLVYEGEWSSAIIKEDNRRAYGELRLRAAIPIYNRLYICIYTERNNRTRIISLRKANLKEVMEYETEID